MRWNIPIVNWNSSLLFWFSVGFLPLLTGVSALFATFFGRGENKERPLSSVRPRQTASSPEDTNVTFHIGSCLTELGQYEEALNYFFKLDFIENNCIKAWRGIMWMWKFVLLVDG